MQQCLAMASIPTLLLLLGAIVTDLPRIELNVTVDHINALAELKKKIICLVCVCLRGPIEK
jgi:hypothetical protein